MRKILCIMCCLMLFASNISVEAKTEEIKEDQDLNNPVSEYFKEVKVEDGIQFAKDTWREYMRYYIVRVRKLDSLKIGDLENIELGKPFVLYNVDGRQQPAYVYLPLYKEGKAVYIINALEYREGKWMYGGGPIAFVIEENQAEILNQMKYEKEECIFYSINNTCYVESETKRFVITKANARDEEMYSEKEEVFLNMNFREKKNTVENGLNELCDIARYNEFDEDVEKQLTGDIENQEKMEVSTKINKEAKALLIFIIGIICFEIVVKRQK